MQELFELKWFKSLDKLSLEIFGKLLLPEFKLILYIFKYKNGFNKSYDKRLASWSMIPLLQYTLGRYK